VAVVAGGIIIAGAHGAQADPIAWDSERSRATDTGGWQWIAADHGILTGTGTAEACPGPSPVSRWRVTYAGGWPEFARQHGIPVGAK
jgi:hypothetical protein